MLDYCPRNMVQVDEHVRTEKPIGKPGSELGKNLILLTMLQNHENKTVEMVSIQLSVNDYRFYLRSVTRIHRFSLVRRNPIELDGWKPLLRGRLTIQKRRFTKNGIALKFRSDFLYETITKINRLRAIDLTFMPYSGDTPLRRHSTGRVVSGGRRCC